MANNHLDRFVQNYTIAPSPQTAAGFGSTLLLVDEAGGNAMAGDRFRVYKSYTALTADVTAGLLSSTTASIAFDMFAQNPSEIVIGRVDTVGGEAYNVGLSACITAGAKFYGIAVDVHTDAVILAVSAATELLQKLFCFQSADVAWKTNNLPAGLTALAGRENTIGSFHDIATEHSGAAYLSNRLRANPDVVSGSWKAGLKEVVPFTAAPSDTEKASMRANFINFGLPLGSENFFIYDGVNIAGRGIYQIVTNHWLKARLDEDWAKMVTEHAARFEKITVDVAGQAKMLAIVNARLSQGVKAGHFLTGNVVATAPALTAGDLTAARIVITVKGTYAQDAKEFRIDLNFSTSSI